MAISTVGISYKISLEEVEKKIPAKVFVAHGLPDHLQVPLDAFRGEVGAQLDHHLDAALRGRFYKAVNELHVREVVVVGADHVDSRLRN